MPKKKDISKGNDHKTELTFAQKLEAIEKAVYKIENEDISIEELISLHKSTLEMIENCEKKLNEVGSQVINIVK